MRTDPTVGVLAWRRQRDDANDFPTHPSAIIALFMVFVGIKGGMVAGESEILS